MAVKQPINATCPECRGPLSTIAQDGLLEFECLVGHRYSAASLLHEHSVTQERQLWAAVVALEETPNLVNALDAHAPPEMLENLQREAERKVEQAKQIRAVLEDLRPFETG